MKRTEVFHNFRKFKQDRDSRSMDDICTNPDGEFRLQVQQKFLREYVQKYPEWKRLMLYHQIGSGKTCSSITLAEECMKMNPALKVTIILPARLRSNYFDELISPCGMDKYINKEDYELMFDSKTSAKKKKDIKARFMDAIKRKYEIISFEKFKIGATKAPSLKEWVENFTRNRLIIIDEVHNLLSEIYDKKKYEQIMTSGIYTRSKGTNTILFKYMSKNMHKTCKMLMLTATPIFNSIHQFKELVYIMDPEANHSNMKHARIGDVIHLLKGKVSFFPGTSPRAYPSVVETVHEVPITKTQYTETMKVMEHDNTNVDREAFMGLQRQISIAALPGGEKVSENIDKVVSNMKEYCPKVRLLLKMIKENVGKHVVYSSFIKSGINVITAALDAKGWVNFNSVKNDPSKWEQYRYKVYAVWDGSVKDGDKSVIKNVVNKVDNIDGKMVRILIGSPSMKEGVSFKHIQHMHLMDPVWNISSKKQVEGRAIRFCSHVDIPENHKHLKRTVDVHTYKLVPKVASKTFKTCDQEIYDHIIPSKEKLVNSCETALKKVAIDYFLFRNMYNKKREPSPRAVTTTQDSVISLDEEDNIKFNAKKRQQKTKTCPKKRRPDEHGNCPEGLFKRKNLYDEECCYKRGG